MWYELIIEKNFCKGKKVDVRKVNDWVDFRKLYEVKLIVRKIEK